jgi:hypothetical protein
MNRFILDSAFGDDLHNHFDEICDNGASAFIWRLGQGLPPYPTAETDNVSRQVANCVRRSRPYAFYFAVHPWSDPIAQAQRTLELAAPYHPSSIWADLELKGNMIEPNISNAYKQYCYYLKDHSNIPIGVYSGQWCITGWFPNTLEWLPDFPYWNASYTAWDRAGNASSWLDFNIKFSNLPWLSYTGYPPVIAYQFTSHVNFIPENADWTKMIDNDWYLYLFEHGPKPVYNPPPLPVTIPYKIRNPLGLATYLRSLPSWNMGANVKLLWNGTRIDVLSNSNGWLKVQPNYSTGMPAGYVAENRAVPI